MPLPLQRAAPWWHGLILGMALLFWPGSFCLGSPTVELWNVAQGSWSNAENWQSLSVPATGDSVVVGSFPSPVISVSSTSPLANLSLLAANFQLNGGVIGFQSNGTLDIRARGTISSQIFPMGTLTIDSSVPETEPVLLKGTIQGSPSTKIVKTGSGHINLNASFGGTLEIERARFFLPA